MFRHKVRASRRSRRAGRPGSTGSAGEAYVELPLGDELEEKVAALAERGLRAKVRCGGAEVPSAEALGRFLASCREAGVPFKATAGLHHPLAADGRHGFLNVLAACVVRGRGRADGRGRAGRGRAPLARPRGRAGGARADRREQLVAVGSCSFFEPVEELKALGIL